MRRFDWWIIDDLVNNDNNSTKLVKFSHLPNTIDVSYKAQLILQWPKKNAKQKSRKQSFVNFSLAVLPIRF